MACFYLLNCDYKDNIKIEPDMYLNNKHVKKKVQKVK